MVSINLLSPNIHSVRDDRGRLVHIEHIREFGQYIEGSYPALLAQSYLVENLPTHYDPDHTVKLDLSTPIGSDFIPKDGSQLRFNTVVSVGNPDKTHVVCYTQTINGLPVWEAGVSVVVSPHNKNLRITSSQSSLHLSPVWEGTDPATAPYLPGRISLPMLETLLGLYNPALDRKVVQFKATRLLYYRYQASPRDVMTETAASADAFLDRLTTLPLPPLPPGIFVGGLHYLVTEVLFTVSVTGSDMRPSYVNWRAFVHTETGFALSVETSLVSCFADPSPALDSNLVSPSLDDPDSFLDYEQPSLLSPNAASASLDGFDDEDVGAIDETGKTGTGGAAGGDMPVVAAAMQMVTANGLVLNADPVTSRGNDLFFPPTSVSDSHVRNLRVPVSFEVSREVGKPVKLSGKWLYITDLWNPSVGEDQAENPSGSLSFNFNYEIITESSKFTAVSAYYHLDSMFGLLEYLGLLNDFFPPNLQVPIRVDPLGTEGAVDARTMGYEDFTRLDSVYYGRLNSEPLVFWGNALDPRITMHEFCHALLWSRLHAPNFPFAHSAGDSLAAILSDPATMLVNEPERFGTYPWLMSQNPALSGRWRYHGGSLRTYLNYAWGGQIDNEDKQGMKPYWGYQQEQILSTSLFRAYCALGGDATMSAHDEIPAARAVKELAARYMSYLIIRAIGGLPPASSTPTSTPDAYVTAMLEADKATVAFPDPALEIPNLPTPHSLAGGAVGKVIKWSFEQQGLYQPPGSSAPVVAPGKQPVDLYIDDSRRGSYAPYLENFHGTTEIWNRRASYATPPNPATVNPLTEHQPPVRKAVNYLYVRVWNWGYQSATLVTMRAYHSNGTPGAVWPNDWSAGSIGSISGPPVGAGGVEIIGPLEWTVPDRPQVLLLVDVSAYGDLSNIDPAAALALPCASGPTLVWRLVPFDNNIAITTMDTA